MSNFKKVKKLANKIPKKKLIKKAGTFVAKKLIGGPYIDVASVVVKSAKNKALSYAGKYAYEKFVRSKYAKEHVNAVPIVVISLIVRTILNILILSKLVTNIVWLDSIISIIVTVIITLLSPLFYISIEAHSKGFMHYTNIFINNFLGPNGYEYLEMVKNVIVFVVAMILLILLQFIDVTSRYIQKIIIHLMITGAISDLIQRWIDTLGRKRRLYYGMTYFKPAKSYKLTDVPTPYRSIQYCDTNNRIIMGSKPQRALVVPKSKLKDYIIIELDPNEKIGRKEIRLINIINDYELDRK